MHITYQKQFVLIFYWQRLKLTDVGLNWPHAYTRQRQVGMLRHWGAKCKHILLIDNCEYDEDPKDTDIILYLYLNSKKFSAITVLCNSYI